MLNLQGRPFTEGLHDEGSGQTSSIKKIALLSRFFPFKIPSHRFCSFIEGLDANLEYCP